MIYYCFVDFSENRLLSDIDKQVYDYLKDHPTENKRGIELLKKFMNSLFVETKSGEFSFLGQINPLNNRVILFFPEGFKGVAIPPPKV